MFVQELLQLINANEDDLGTLTEFEVNFDEVSEKESTTLLQNKDGKKY